MTCPARVVVIALDACDRDIIRRLAAEGRVPAIAALLARGAVAETHNPDWLFVGAVWPTFATGTSPVRHLLFNWEQIDGGTYDRRDTSPTEMQGDWFWEVASDAGRRVAAIDVPHIWPRRPVDGVVVSEWGCHDRHFGLHAHPTALRDELTARYPLHEVSGLDADEVKQFCPDDEVHRAGPLRVPAEEQRLWEDHLAGLATKTDLTIDLLEQGGWDLFTVVFGESHNVGHQLFHVHDATHPRHDPAVRATIGDPLEGIYEELDRSVGRIVEAAGPEARVVLLCSHGMAAHHDGTHMLDAILYRLQRAKLVGTEGSLAGRAAKASLGALPTSARHQAMRAAAAVQRRRLAGTLPPVERDHWGTDIYAWPYFLSPNNTVFGGIRLNVCGREPRGVVLPTDVDRVVERLRDDLLGIVNVDTGEPAVRAVHRLEESYPDRAEVDALPDVLIDWNRSHAIETVWSPVIGLLHEPYTHWRTGDHRNGGLVAVAGPGVAPGPVPTVDSRSLAPTFTAWLGVNMAGADLGPEPALGPPLPASVTAP